MVPGARRRFWASESDDPRSHFVFHKISSDFVGTRIVRIWGLHLLCDVVDTVTPKALLTLGKMPRGSSWEVRGSIIPDTFASENDVHENENAAPYYVCLASHGQAWLTLPHTPQVFLPLCAAIKS